MGPFRGTKDPFGGVGLLQNGWAFLHVGPPPDKKSCVRLLFYLHQSYHRRQIAKIFDGTLEGYHEPNETSASAAAVSAHRSPAPQFPL